MWIALFGHWMALLYYLSAPQSEDEGEPIHQETTRTPPPAKDSAKAGLQDIASTR